MKPGRYDWIFIIPVSLMLVYLAALAVWSVK